MCSVVWTCLYGIDMEASVLYHLHNTEVTVLAICGGGQDGCLNVTLDCPEGDIAAAILDHFHIC